MRMTQKDKILRHMQTYGSITQAEAYADYGCFRLGARIADLKADGHNIESKLICGKNRFGEATHYASYSLRGGC